MSNCLVGVDVGGTWVRVAAESEDGARTPVLVERTPASYADFLDLVENLARKAAAGPVDRVCCGLPGTSRGPSADFVPALSWIEGRPVGIDLARRLDAQVTLALDGHLTLLAEVREGAARDRSSAALVAVGTGIGGALMIGGRIWRGCRGTAGSWGWLPACDGHDDREHGQFEQVAAGSTLSMTAAARPDPLTGPALVDAARHGDATAARLLDDYADHLGRGIAAIASIIDPEIVLVGGGLSAAMDVLAPLIERRVSRLASPNGRLVEISAAMLGPHGGVVGALHAARDGQAVWL